MGPEGRGDRVMGKLYDSYFSQNIWVIKKNEVDGACGTQGRQERCIQGFGGEPERKRQFGRSRHFFLLKFRIGALQHRSLKAYCSFIHL
jgi:hypothetical protein